MSDTPETDGITFFALPMGMPPYDTVPAEFAKRLERERDESRKSEMAAILERERWKMRAEEKWAMRRELEELLGVESLSPSDEQFSKGIEALRRLIRERDEANKELHKQLVKYDALFNEAENIRKRWRWPNEA